jgi:hypothetical protein
MSDLKDTQETKSSRLQIWGAAIILLMIGLMLMPANLTSLNQDGGQGILIGTASDGRKITSQDRLYASNLIDALQQIYVVAGDDELLPLLTACWGDDRVRAFKGDPEAFFLLLQEARKVSPGPSVQALGELDESRQSDQMPGLLNSGMVSVDDLHPAPDSPLGEFRFRSGQPFPVELRVTQRRQDRISQLAPRSLPPLEQRAVYGAFYDFLTIQSAASLPLNAIKVSDPVVDLTIGSLAQIFTLEVAPFDAANFIAQVPEPTDARLAAHLKQYGGEVAGTPTRTNPFGFGYRVPDRVRFQSIWVARDDVRRLVEAEKTPYQWEVDARIAFQRNPSAFSEPTTQPAAATQSTTQPGASVATRPAVPSNFEEVRDRAMTATIDAATDARMSDIERRISTTMSFDYNAWIGARAAKTAMPSSSLGIVYESPGYLDRMAADIEARFKVKPQVRDFTDQPYDREALLKISDLQAASVEVPVQTAIKLQLDSLRIPAAAYVIELAEPLMEPKLLERAGELALSLFEPSAKFTTVVGDRVSRSGYVRLTAAEPDHPQTQIDPIRTTLVSDVRRVEAQKLALARAESVSTELAKGQVPTVEGASLRTVVVGPFTGQSPIPAGLDLTMPQYLQLGEAVADQLLGTAGPTPAAALNVPLAGRAYAARRTNVAAVWPSTEALQSMRQRTRVAIRQTMSLPKRPENRFGMADDFVGSSWLDVKDIFKRNAWQPAASDEATTQP